MDHIGLSPDTMQERLRPIVEAKSRVEELNPGGAHSILLVGGISEGVETQRGLAESLAEGGLRVISFDYPLALSKLKTYGKDYYPKHIEEKAEQTADVIDAYKPRNEGLIIVAHSMGSLVAVKAATRTIEGSVDQLILLNPAGLFKDSLPRLMGRFAHETARKSTVGMTKKYGRVQQAEGTKQMLTKPTRFLGDAVDIAHGDIRAELEQIREMGIKVDVVLSNKDRVFPWSHIEWDNRSDEGGMRIEDIAVDSLSSFAVTRQTRSGKPKPHRLAGQWAGHDQSINYPEQTARLLHQLIAK